MLAEMIQKTNVITTVYFSVGGVLFLLAAFLLYNFGQDKYSFFCLYLAVYCWYFYVLCTVTVSAVVLACAFYVTLFLSYNWYYTFSKRFMLRSYSVVKTYFTARSFLKIILWTFFVLFPTAMNSPFVFLMIYHQLIVLSWIGSQTTVQTILVIVYFWYCFLGISHYFHIFLNVREKILNYFSRRACLHFIGNVPGKNLTFQGGLKIGAAIGVAILPSTMAHIDTGYTAASHKAEAAVNVYKAEHPNATRVHLQMISDRTYHIQLEHYGMANRVSKMTGGMLGASPTVHPSPGIESGPKKLWPWGK
jgi:hypothetical protein